jgi:hypothetical protein
MRLDNWRLFYLSLKNQRVIIIFFKKYRLQIIFIQKNALKAFKFKDFSFKKIFKKKSN